MSKRYSTFCRTSYYLQILLSGVLVCVLGRSGVGFLRCRHNSLQRPKGNEVSSRGSKVAIELNLSCQPIFKEMLHGEYS
jgi:hypothetical protein